MAISFANALGIHEKALSVRVERAEVLANNLANADTPGYKARDIDFKAILAGQAEAMSRTQIDMARTNARHISVGQAESQAELLYRKPSQPAVDGNTVDTQIETAEFMKNTLQFQSSFQFLNGKFKSLSSAIKANRKARVVVG